jgi:hypothetical protein
MNKETIANIKAVLMFLAVFAAIIIFTIGFMTFMAADCQQRAQAMGLNWMFSPGHGCYVQQPNGSWMPIDQPVQVLHPY